MRPWEAQKEFNKRAENIKEPYDITVAPVSKGFCIEWKRRPGLIDGFIILVGNDPETLLEIARIPKEGNQIYSKTFDDFRSGNYYVTVVAYKDEKSSNRPSPISVTVRHPHQSSPSVDTSSVEEEPIEANVLEELSENTQIQHSENNGSENIINESIEATCGHCNGNIVLNTELGVYECLTCGAKLVKNVKDQLVYLNRLQNGICNCCNPKRPLVTIPGEQYPKCFVTGEEYARLSENETVKISDLDYGLCTCCTPPNPLMLNQQSQVVCSRERDHLHIKENDRWIYHEPEPDASSVDEVNEALANGSATMGPNGIIDTD